MIKQNDHHLHCRAVINIVESDSDCQEIKNSDKKVKTTVEDEEEVKSVESVEIKFLKESYDKDHKILQLN